MHDQFEASVILIELKLKMKKNSIQLITSSQLLD
jgi:hypothetical protein